MMGYSVVTEIPPGWSMGERYGAGNAMWRLGEQNNVNPALKMHLRPNRPTRWNDEETPEITDAATAWILAGDMTNITRAGIVAIIAEELDVNPIAVDAKITVTDYNHAGILQFLRDNIGEWGEGE